MKSLFTLAFLLILGVPFGFAQTAGKGPLDTYKDYAATLAKTSSLEELLPYYTKDLREGLAKMPKDMQGNYLKMNKRTLSDLKVTKESVTASKAVYEMSAKLPDGRSTQGKVTMVKEGATWRVDDDAWATSQK